MLDWLTDNKIPVGDWAEAGFDWLRGPGGSSSTRSTGCWRR